MDAGVPRRSADGLPETRRRFIPTTQVEILDPWRVSGVRSTGSHDVLVDCDVRKAMLGGRGSAPAAAGCVR